MTDLGAWIETRAGGAARRIRAAVSAVGLEHEREALGQRVRPAAGSVLASSARAHWNPEPDYFYHWQRDAAIAMRQVPALIRRAPEDAAWWRRAFADYVAFSLTAFDPDRPPLSANPLRVTMRADALRFLRPDAELAALSGDAVLAEPRCAPDGAPDLERWSRPQFDGPALRASSCLLVVAAAPECGGEQVDALITGDLAFTQRVAGAACIGPWEDPPLRRDAFTLIAQWDALDRGSDWRAERGEAADAAALREAAGAVLAALEPAWNAAAGSWRAAADAGPGEIDAAVILAILGADRGAGPLALNAPRTRSTVAALEQLFSGLYPINRRATPPAIGRLAGDVFCGGNPWFPTTLAFAELHYRLALMGVDPERTFARADGYMALIRKVAPEGDALPEQFDRATGAPVSCRDLTWSAAAFLAAADARAAAVQAGA